MIQKNNSFPESILAPEADYLFIQTSGIEYSGKGLFTAINIYKNEIIATYKGEIIGTKEAEERTLNKQNTYFMNLPSGKILDAQQTDNFAKYANDANGSLPIVYKNNAFITLNHKNEVCLVALKNIKALSEIFCSYGNAYWLNLKKMENK
jgi:SET domain-containing protein